MIEISNSALVKTQTGTGKPQTSEGWINGTLFVLEPGILEYIKGDATQWEREPLERLVQDGQLRAYMHHYFLAHACIHCAKISAGANVADHPGRFGISKHLTEKALFTLENQ